MIVTVDSDCVIERGALLEIAGPFRDARVGAVAGKVAVHNRRASLIPRMLHVRFILSFDYLRSARVEPDERVADAVEGVATRQQDGRWPLQYPHPDPPRRWNYPVDFDMEDGEGKASRWNTLRALRVLDWYSARD